MNLIKYLENKYSNVLSANEKSILHKIAENIEFVPNSTLSELAKIVYSSPTSLHRLVKKIGFDGYIDFKYSIEKELSDKSQPDFYTNQSDYFINTLNDINITYKLNEEKFDKIVKEIINHNDLYCFGTGWKQKQLVDNFANDLLYYHHSFKTLRNIDDLKLASKQFKSNSLLIIVSLSGNMKGYCHIVESIKNNGNIIISVTLNTENSLKRISDYSLTFIDSSISKESHHWSSIPLSFLLDQLVHKISVYSSSY